ncbi:MAG: 30S ribosomal protein S8e [Candidatus Thermoplasmatota archaeon]|nr:30S ribosomal protein S8e [Candidatus Thermoplasmatota archaeon]
MALWQGKSRRKPTGGRRVRHRGKRRFEVGRETQLPTIGESRRAITRIRGGNTRVRVVREETANVTDPSTGDTKRAEIKTVVENPANIHYVRRNFITKGAILETSMGRARVTSRPGQDGVINAVLVD